MEEVFSRIPQRPPFLFVDKIIGQDQKSIHTQKYLTGEEDFFKGHFPGNPIMPGVLLQEAAFQTGAILLSSGANKGIGLVTRVEDVKFRDLVRPGDLLDIFVEHTNTLMPAYFFRAKIKVKDKIVASLSFSCVLKES